MNLTSTAVSGSRAAPVGEASESLWTIMKRTYCESPVEVRRSAFVVLVCGGMTILAQTVLDGDNGRGAEGVMQTLGLAFGWLGMMLLATTVLLQSGSQRIAGAVHAGTRIGPQRMHPMLVVTPVLALCAACLIGISIGAVLSRAAVRSPWLALAALPFLIFVGFAGRLVVDSCRFLYTHAREQAELASRASADAAEAQLATLTAQLHPHYLFNALNTVAALVRTNPKAAEATVENVAQVLRKTLDRSARTWAPLAEEIDYLKAYLAVEEQRWGERLEVHWRVAPRALRIEVPPLVLQPLVENALRHGLGERLEGGRIEIEAELAEDRLQLVVIDNGAGLLPRYAERTGLSNLRRRLATLYGEAATLTLESRAVGGTRVVILLPSTGRREGA